MKIIVASDSFKGSLTSWEANAAIASGLSKILPDAEIIAVAVADGGEGTSNVLAEALACKSVRCASVDALGRPIEARYGISEGGIAYMDMASASGLTLIDKEARNPMAASSFGTGMMIRDARERGCRQIVIGLGGSATCDGGIGMLAALGVKFYDSDSSELKPNGANLQKIFNINAERLSDMEGLEITVAVDVDNPLYGPDGAACVFAPQKGATPEQVMLLDAGLRNFARVTANLTGHDYASLSGAGAAGGMGFALAAYLGANIMPGIDIVLDAQNFDSLLRDADYVFTGEGCLDAQTLMGKAPVGILARAARCGIPTVAIGGMVKNREILEAAGFDAVLEVDSGGMSLSEAMQMDNARRNIEKTVARFALNNFK